MPPPDSQAPARSKTAVDRLIARRDVHFREKTLWRMLYETVARSEDTGLVRLSYGQARALLDAYTAVGGVPGAGWDLHECRHASLTHLGKAGAGLVMLMAKSRHKKPENVRKYLHPSAESIAEVTSLLAPGDSRR
ncbi:hypothetical protein ACIBI0_12540 [Microbispora rosea]|uniref:hypothetical protein n=1 Tax=Microbispora rosea TaxID=58117 RepID=UPI0037A5C12C